jgi:Xaa-Pro aminopeptidase
LSLFIYLSHLYLHLHQEEREKARMFEEQTRLLNEHNAAATRIQSLARGRETRKKVRAVKAEAEVAKKQEAASKAEVRAYLTASVKIELFTHTLTYFAGSSSRAGKS